MLRISFPSMGWSKIAFGVLFHGIEGIEVVIPPRVNSKIAEMGIKHSPEFVCFPFKIVLGEFINLIENFDVHTLIMGVGCGPCRFGYYAPVLDRILKDLGYDVNVIPFQQADLTNFEWTDSFYKTAKIAGIKLGRFRILKSSYIFLLKSKYVEKILHLSGLIRCREYQKGDTSKIVEKLMDILYRTNSYRLLRRFDRIIKHEFRKIPIKRDIKPLRIMVTGEIHVNLEPYVNMNIMRKLGELGVEIHRAFHCFDWVKHRLNINIKRKKLEKIAQDYVSMDIGGEAIWNCGEYISCQQKGFDGFIHLYPFLCMPEVTLKGIIEGQALKKFYLPIQYYSIDEHTAYEGLRTRLETFISLMESNREHNPRFKDRYVEPPEISDLNEKTSLIGKIKGVLPNIFKFLKKQAVFFNYTLFNGKSKIEGMKNNIKKFLEFLIYGERKLLLN